MRFFLKFSNILEGCSTIFLLVLIKIGFSNISFYCSNMYTQCSNIPSRSSNIHSVSSNIRMQCSNKTINPIHPSLNLHPPSPLLPDLLINTQTVLMTGPFLLISITNILIKSHSRCIRHAILLIKTKKQPNPISGIRLFLHLF